MKRFMTNLTHPYMPATALARTYLYMCGQKEPVYVVGRDAAVGGCGVCAGKGGEAFGTGLMHSSKRSGIPKSYKKLGK